MGVLHVSQWTVLFTLVLTLVSAPFIDSVSLPEALLHSLEPEAPMEDLVIPLGYPFENHTVHTGDGYRLAVYRIPHGRDGVNRGRRPVAFLQHGLLDSSAAFAMNGVNGSVAFALADAGFDVWLGNSRGNSFSNFRIQSSMTYNRFWDFSLDELIHHDLPETLEYVLDQTSVKKLVFVGHSQGTAIGFALFGSGHPVVKHIAVAIMMAPVAFVRHITSPVLRGMALTNVDILIKLLGFREFLPSSIVLEILGGTFCRDVPHACENALAAFCGYNPDNIDPEKWATFLKYTPSGTSVKLMVHWKQGILAFSDAQFRAYDYGMNCWNWFRMESQPCNQLVYKTEVPPEYKIRDIRVPLVFFQGGQDALSDPSDVESLKHLLRPRVLLAEYLYPEYTHLDYIWGKNADDKVCSKILNVLKDLYGPSMNPEREMKQ